LRESCVFSFAALFFLSASGLFLSVGGALAAGMVNARGELTCNNCIDFTGYMVELHNINGYGQVDRIMVRQNGDFDIHVESGTYSLVVLRDNNILSSEIVHIKEAFGSLYVRVPNAQPKSKPGTGVVSLERIKHKIVKAAQKEYETAEKRYRAGDIDGSLEHLKRATEIDPEYLEAWNNLGCRYMMKEQTSEAVSAFEKATAIDNQAPLIYTNLGLAHLRLGDIARAETAARQAVENDTTDLKARYILGLSLVLQRKFTDEAVALLRQVGNDFPNAQAALAEALARRSGFQKQERQPNLVR
jgi:tetratricopeptide (TPR) repeat protein